MNDDVKQTSAKPRRPTLATAVMLSLALHIAGLGLWSLWPVKTLDRTPAPPPIKIKAVFEEAAVEKKHASAEAKNRAPAGKAAKSTPRDIAKAQNAAEPAHPLPAQAAPALAGPRRLSPEDMPQPSVPTAHNPAQAAPDPVARKPLSPAAPIMAEPLSADRATPLARVATASKTPPSIQAAPRAVTGIETTASLMPPAAKEGMARRVSHSPEGLLPQEAIPLSAASGGAPPVGQPAAPWQKIVRAPSSPLQPIAVESQSSNGLTVQPRAPVAAVMPGVVKDQAGPTGPLPPAAVPDHFSTLDLGALRDGYSSTVRNRIARARYYPDKGRAAGHEGRPVVSFLLGGGGELLELSLAESSGHSTLDVAAIQAVERAAPFPEIPAPLNETSMRFKLPVSFRLESP